MHPSSSELNGYIPKCSCWSNLDILAARSVKGAIALITRPERLGPWPGRESSYRISHSSVPQRKSPSVAADGAAESLSGHKLAEPVDSAEAVAQHVLVDVLRELVALRVRVSLRSYHGNGDNQRTREVSKLSLLIRPRGECYGHGKRERGGGGGYV